MKSPVKSEAVFVPGKQFVPVADFPRVASELISIRLFNEKELSSEHTYK